jgi:hypothetical protein
VGRWALVGWGGKVLNPLGSGQPVFVVSYPAATPDLGYSN